jgi:hypothetical protein
MRSIQGLAQSFRVVAGTSRNLSKFMEDTLKGEKLILADGAVITVTSVDNAGFNGMQVGGYTAEGKHRVGYSR